jgi:hypothetical protein
VGILRNFCMGLQSCSCVKTLEHLHPSTLYTLLKSVTFKSPHLQTLLKSAVDTFQLLFCVYIHHHADISRVCSICSSSPYKVFSSLPYFHILIVQTPLKPAAFASPTLQTFLRSAMSDRDRRAALRPCSHNAVF